MKIKVKGTRPSKINLKGTIILFWILKGVFAIFDDEHMLNGAISNFTPSKDFLIRSSVWPVGPKTWCGF